VISTTRHGQCFVTRAEIVIILKHGLRSGDNREHGPLPGLTLGRLYRAPGFDPIAFLISQLSLLRANKDQRKWLTPDIRLASLENTVLTDLRNHVGSELLLVQMRCWATIMTPRQPGEPGYLGH
jgi:hypothetical protein